jgi:RNA polymerase sigma-70 factor, ECF subfamily
MAAKPQLSRPGSVLRWADVPEYELVRLTKTGNILAFEELVSRTTDICLRIATRILRSQQDARDEVQNAFWLAHSRIELFTYQSKFSTWLARIVINRCLVRLRTDRRKSLVVNEVTTDNHGRYTYEATTRDTPEIDLGRREVSQAVRRELRSVPPLLRIPIELHYMDELPVKEVARQLGLTIAAAKSRLHRGHLYLRDRMLKHVPRRGAASLTTAH